MIAAPFSTGITNGRLGAPRFMSVVYVAWREFRHDDGLVPHLGAQRLQVAVQARFAAEYAPMNGMPRLPGDRVIATICPPPCARNTGRPYSMSRWRQ